MEPRRMQLSAIPSHSPGPPIAPPRWMVRESIRSVIERRLRTARPQRVQELVQSTPDRVRYYLEWNTKYALVGLHPASETSAFESRIERFGHAFPGLFNINGAPRTHDLRPAARDEPGFIGAHELNRRGPILVRGERPFGPTLVTNCLMRIEPNASIALSGLVIKSDKQAPKKFQYKLHFVYIVAFGDQISHFDFVDEYERVLVMYFGGSDVPISCEVYGAGLAEGLSS